MGSRISDKPSMLFEVFLEIGKPEGSGAEPFIIHQFPEDYDDKETLAMVPKFAYPCETDASNVDHFTFVLTDIDSMFRFGYCRHATGHQTCLCMLSCLPWCEVFFKILDLLAEITNRSEQNCVNDFLQATYSHEIPLPKIPVTIVANEDMFSFSAPDPNLLPSIPNSRNLTEYYNAVDTNNMMRIFVSMLQERRIYMISKKLSRLTACIHAAEALLYPMHWQHLYIPVLPAHLIDYISAPMPYLIGVHSNLVEKLKINRVDVADAVVVDLDSNTVTTEYDDLESMPEEVSSYLKKNLKADIVKNSMMKDGDAISKAFLHALVRLIGGYRAGLKIKPGEPITFDPELFVHSRPSQTMQNYLEGMLALQIFQQFIYGRLEILNSGVGFVDIFEQQATFYADKITSQSSYREWVKNVKKSGRKGKEVWNGLKVKLMLSVANREKVKVQSKKAVADIRTKISSITEDDKRSSFHVSGGIVHSKPDKHSSTIIYEEKKTKRPPRPPPPSNRNSSEILKNSASDSQDDSNLRLSYHKVDMSLMADEDIQAAMMRSASAEALPKHSQVSSGSSSSLTSSAEETDGANIPFGSLQSSDDESNSIEKSALTLPPSSVQSKSTIESSLDGDRLIVSRVWPNAQAPSRPSTVLKVTDQQPVAPPRTKRNNASPNLSPQIVRHFPPAPRVQPRTSLIKFDDGKDDSITTISTALPDAPLIHFESSESESTESDVFDPLGKPKSVSQTPQGNEGCSSSVSDFIIGDDDTDNQEVQIRKLERNRGSRSSLTRSEAFRRESQKGPVRSGCASDAKDESDDDEVATLPKEIDDVIFDPLSTKDHARTLPKPPANNDVFQQRSRTSSDLMKHEWSLVSLAPSPHVHLPLGMNKGVGIGPKSNSLNPRNSFEQPRLIRQSTLSANPFPVTTSMQTRGQLHSQASISVMPSAPLAVTQNRQVAQLGSIAFSANSGLLSLSKPNTSSPQRLPGHRQLPVPPQTHPAATSSLLSTSRTNPRFNQLSSSSSSNTTSVSLPFGHKVYRPVQPSFNSQGLRTNYSGHCSTIASSSFIAPSSRAHYPSSPARNSAAQKQAADPFGDLISLELKNVENIAPQQPQPEKMAANPQPKWETFD